MINRMLHDFCYGYRKKAIIHPTFFYKSLFMSTEQTLLQRSDSKCELCTSEQNLTAYNLPPESEDSAEKSVLLCATCHGPGPMDLHFNAPEHTECRNCNGQSHQTVQSDDKSCSECHERGRKCTDCHSDNIHKLKA